MRPRDHHNVDVILALELFLRKNDLAREGRAAILVLRVGDRGSQNADRPDDPPLAHGLALRGVGRVADHKLCLRHLLTRPHAADLASFIVLEAIHGLIQHVRSTVNRRKAGETLRQTAESIDRIDEGRAPVLRNRIHVHLALLNCRAARLPPVVVGRLQGHRVTDEIDRALCQIKLLVNLVHCVPLRINSLQRLRIRVVPIHDERGKVEEARLLKHAHQRRLQSILCGCRDLVDVLCPTEKTSFLVLVDISPLARLEL
mmetsp:Transcript_2854/g.5975  ORF Transcript_2854/g.5975 Transcript_2854/m.5975 type:complete len:258 (+) Transcript_2854:362-1135(+)